MRARLSGVVSSWKTESAMVSMSIRDRLISARPRRENDRRSSMSWPIFCVLSWMTEQIRCPSISNRGP